MKKRPNRKLKKTSRPAKPEAAKGKAKKRKRTQGSGMGSSRNLGYFLFQVFIILGAFIGISRCSPLAPSQNIAALEAGSGGGGPTGRRADTTGSAATAAIAQNQLQSLLDASPRDIAVEYVFIRASGDVSEPSRLLFRLGLASVERDQLRNNLGVEMSLAKRSADMNKSTDEIQASLRALRQNLSAARPTLRLYLVDSQVPRALKQRLSAENLAGNLAASDIDGRIRLGNLKAGDSAAFREALGLAEVVYLDI